MTSLAKPSSCQQFRRRRRLLAGTLALVMLAVGAPSARGQADARVAAMESAFGQELRRAHESKDVDAAMRLVYWSGAEPATKEAFAADFKDTFAMKVDRIEFAPTPPNQITRYTRNGKTYRTNLDVKKVLVVRFKAQPGIAQVNSTTYLIGEKEGKYFITPAVPAL